MIKKSMLFVNPDYHYSFTLQDELRAKGWKADVFVGRHYPEKMLYSDDAIRLSGSNNVILDYIKALVLFIRFMLNYKYFLIYNSENIVAMPFSLGKDHCFDLSIAKLLGKKILYVSSGCSDVEIKSVFSKYDAGNVCNNCGWSEELCNDTKNMRRIRIKKRYGNMFIGYGINDSTKFLQRHLKYKSLNLDFWRPDLGIPDEFLLPRTSNIRVLHGFVSENRENRNCNIKGSPAILAAVNNLKKDGLPVELMYLKDIPPKFMRYYLLQADIVVDQLIYGWWGSIGIEAMASSKPVVCYLRKEWKDYFLSVFSEYNSLPIVEANTENIYEVLKDLVTDEKRRALCARASRLFAQKQYDVRNNCIQLEDAFLSL